MSELYNHYGMKISKGDCLFREGDTADRLFMIKKGRIQISKGAGEKNKTILILGEGEFVGEMAVINFVPRSATAFALEDCELISMDTESFYGAIRDNRQFAVSVIKMLSDRLRDTTEAIPVLTERDRRQRVLIEIMGDLIKNGKKDSSGNWFMFEYRKIMKSIISRGIIDRTGFIHMVDDLVAQGRINIKKDSGGETWIAHRREQYKN